MLLNFVQENEENKAELIVEKKGSANGLPKNDMATEDSDQMKQETSRQSHQSGLTARTESTNCTNMEDVSGLTSKCSNDKFDFMPSVDDKASLKLSEGIMSPSGNDIKKRMDKSEAAGLIYGSLTTDNKEKKQEEIQADDHRRGKCSFLDE